MRGKIISGAGIELGYPVRVVRSAPAIEHVPFALWIVEAHRPQTIVELCISADNTYCGFLQAILGLNLEAKGFAVSLAGTGIAASASDFNVLKAHHDPLYGAFSTLSRASLPDALMRFADRSIDLLEIGAPLTGDDPFDDLDAWLPKMSARGVILLQGIAAHPQSPKVAAFWDKLSSSHSSFAFTHDRGLGVVYVGSEPLSGPLQTLLEAREPHNVAGIRAYFARLGTSVAERAALAEAEAKLAVSAASPARAVAQNLQSTAAQRDVLTRIVRQQSLTVIRLERELHNPITRSFLFRALRFLFRTLVPLSVRRYIRRQLPLQKMSQMARSAPPGLKRHIPLSLKQFLARQLSSG